MHTNQQQKAGEGEKSQYCKSCADAFSYLFANFGSEGDSKFQIDIALHDSVDALEASAAAGCLTCRLFRHTFHVRKANNWEITSEHECTFRLSRKRIYRINNLTTSDIDLKIQKSEYLVLHFREFPPLPGHEQAHSLSGTSWGVDRAPIDSDDLQLEHVFDEHSRFAFASMKRMLDKCQSTHGQICKHGSLSDPGTETKPFLPTRLIEITEQSGHLQLRLALSKDMLTSRKGALSAIEYTTLSYCWGTFVNFFTTTNENYVEHQLSIPYQDLPATFQHAIFITHKLGVRYIWIDALCIIQPTKDNTIDWDIESRKMHDVYRWSLVTISASSASNVTLGCFTERPALKYPIKPCLLTDLVPDKFDTTGRDVRELTLRTVAPKWQSNVEIAPVSRRGWILQERMLSRRIFHFTNEAIFWECTELRASDYEPDGANQTRFAAPLLKSLLVTENPCEEWWSVVEKFSSRSLTCVTDKLPALSGVAAMFNDMRPGEYLAGIWKQDLPASLLWWSPLYEYDARNPPRPRVSEIPTWSWASVMTPVDFNRVHNLTSGGGSGWKLNILDTSLTLATDSPFGRVFGGSLHLEGQLKVFSLRDIDTTKVMDRGNVPLSVLDISSAVYMYFDEIQWLLRKDLTQLNVPCVLLYEEHDSAIRREEGFQVGQRTYIALEQVPDSEKRQYKRIGILVERLYKNDTDLSAETGTVENGGGIKDMLEEIELV